ncbi:MAG: LamG domain-containing protein, partial [Microthrixaceae bacterium]|nr:LamG domain-containing protein [Microthrixaceae bacterium]
DAQSIPRSVGAAGEVLAQLAWPFIPSRIVFHAGDLDGNPGYEIAAGADGDPGEHDNFVWILVEQGGVWRTNSVPVGPRAITSLAGGCVGADTPVLFCGYRDPVEGGGILRLVQSNGAWRAHAVLRASSTAAFVLGELRGQDRLAAILSTTGSVPFALHAVYPVAEGWTSQVMRATASSNGIGLVIRDAPAATTYSNAVVRKLDGGLMEIVKSDPYYIDRDHLRLELLFERGTGDSSDRARDVSVAGGSLTADRTGQASQAYHFGGADYLRIANARELGFDMERENFSLALWVRADAVGDGGDLIFREPAFAYEGFPYRLRVDAARRVVFEQFDLSRTNAVVAGTALVPGQWHHLAVVISAGVVELWQDGVLLATGELHLASPNQGAVVVGRGFEGAMDDVRIFNKPLTPVELDELGLRTHRVRTVAHDGESRLAELVAGMLARTGPVACAAAPAKVYRYVGGSPPPTNYTWASTHATIQSAVNAAGSNDWILVDSGAYAPISIGKPLFLRSLNGRDATIIDASNTPRAVHMS